MPNDDLISTEDLEFGPGAFDLPEPQVGLAALASYRGTLTVSFTGTTSGQADVWSTMSMMVVGAEPSGRVLTIGSTGGPAPAAPVMMAERAGAAYERIGVDDCQATPIDPEATLSATMEPAASLPGILGADEAGSETIDGIATNHYTFDERAIAQLGVAKSTGDVWVAVDGGFVVKYVLTSVGTASMFGADTEGSVTWLYDLTDIGHTVAIQLPADCPAGMLTEVPSLPDAVDLVSEPGVISYTTASPAADVGAFYLAQLPGLGWLPKDEASIQEGAALQDFVRNDEQLSMIVTTGEAGTTVLLLLGPIEA